MILSAAPDIAAAIANQSALLLIDLRRLRRKFIWLFSLSALAAVTLVTTSLYLFYPHPEALWQPAILFSLALSIPLLKIVDTVYRRRLAEATILGLTTDTGLRHLPHGVKRVEDLEPHRIMPGLENAIATNGYTGWYRGATVALQSVTSENAGRTLHWLVMLIQFARPLAGHTIMTTSNATGTIFAGRFEDFGMVGIGDPASARQIDVRASDRAEGRLLTGGPLIEAFIQTGLRLKSEWAAASFRETEACFIFDDDAMLSATPGIIYAVTPDLVRRITGRMAMLLGLVDTLADNHRIDML